MHLVHVIGRFYTFVLLTQSSTDIRLQFNSHTRLGCIQLHQQKPFACNSPRNPLLGKQLFRHLLIQAKCKLSYFFNVHIKSDLLVIQ